MSLSLALAIYFICWWIVLLGVLPLRFGSQSDTADEHATASGAPMSPRLALKFAVTTGVSLAVFACIYAVFAFRLVELDDIPFLRY